MNDTNLTSSLFLARLFEPVVRAAPSFVPRSHGVVSPLSKSAVLQRVYGGGGGGTSTQNHRRSNNDIRMMPIGVPKVAYRVPGSQSADWYVLS